MATGRASTGASSTLRRPFSRRMVARGSFGGNRKRLAESGPQVVPNRRGPAPSANR